MDNKISNQQIAAKRYIEENNLERIVSEMLNSLVHEKSKTPILYMIKYLAGLLTEEERKSYNLQVPEPYPKGKPIVGFPNLSDNKDSLLKKYLSKSIWATTKYNKTVNNGSIMNVIKLGESDNYHPIGITLTDSDCIQQFYPLINPIVNELHKLSKNEIKEVNQTNVNIVNENDMLLNNKLISYSVYNYKDSIYKSTENSKIYFPFQDLNNPCIFNLKFEFFRNLEGYPLNNITTKEKLESVNLKIRSTIETIIKRNSEIDNNNNNNNNIDSNIFSVLNKGKFITLNKENYEMYIALLSQEYKSDVLIDNNYLKFYEVIENYINNASFKLCWPEYRSVFISENKEVIILINFTDHLQVIFNCSYTNNILKTFDNYFNFIKEIERNLKFETSGNFGYTTCCPSLLGAGLKIKAEIKVKQFFKSKYNYSKESCLINNYISYIDIINLSKKDNSISKNNDNYDYNNKLMNKLDVDFYLYSKNCINKNKDDLLFIESNHKLIYNDEYHFLSVFYGFISSICFIDNVKQENFNISFDLKEIEEDSSRLSIIYTDIFNEYKSNMSVSPSGKNINSIFFNKNTIYGGIVVSELCDIYYFKDVIKSYMHGINNKILFTSSKSNKIIKESGNNVLLQKDELKNDNHNKPIKNKLNSSLIIKYLNSGSNTYKVEDFLPYSMNLNIKKPLDNIEYIKLTAYRNIKSLDFNNSYLCNSELNNTYIINKLIEFKNNLQKNYNEKLDIKIFNIDLYLDKLNDSTFLELCNEISNNSDLREEYNKIIIDDNFVVEDIDKNYAILKNYVINMLNIRLHSEIINNAIETNSTNSCFMSRNNRTCIVIFEYNNLDMPIVIITNDLYHLRIEYSLFNKFKILDNNLQNINNETINYIKFLLELHNIYDIITDELLGYIGPLPYLYGTGFKTELGYKNIDTSDNNELISLITDSCNKYNVCKLFDIENKNLVSYTNSYTTGITEIDLISNILNFYMDISKLKDISDKKSADNSTNKIIKTDNKDLDIN